MPFCEGLKKDLSAQQYADEPVRVRIDYRDIRGRRAPYSARELARRALRDAGWPVPEPTWPVPYPDDRTPASDPDRPA